MNKSILNCSKRPNNITLILVYMNKLILCNSHYLHVAKYESEICSSTNCWITNYACRALSGIFGHLGHLFLIFWFTRPATVFFPKVEKKIKNQIAVFYFADGRKIMSTKNRIGPAIITKYYPNIGVRHSIFSQHTIQTSNAVKCYKTHKAFLF